MSAGSIAGGYLGARLTMHERAKFWIFRILVAVLLLEVVHLAFQYVAPYIRLGRWHYIPARSSWIAPGESWNPKVFL
jgi:hypothetical protein